MPSAPTGGKGKKSARSKKPSTPLPKPSKTAPVEEQAHNEDASAQERFHGIPAEMEARSVAETKKESSSSSSSPLARSDDRPVGQKSSEDVIRAEEPDSPEEKPAHKGPHVDLSVPQESTPLQSKQDANNEESEARPERTETFSAEVVNRKRPRTTSPKPVRSITSTRGRERQAARSPVKETEGGATSPGSSTSTVRPKEAMMKGPVDGEMDSSAEPDEPGTRATRKEERHDKGNAKTTAVEAPAEGTPQQRSSTTSKSETSAPHSKPPSPTASTPTVVGSPTSTSAQAKLVFNIAGVNVPAFLAEASDPPPMFVRANKARRNRRRKHMTAENAVFQQHVGLREDPQAYSKFFEKAPMSTEKDVVNSLNEFTDSPALAYAELLWKYTPEAVISMAMMRNLRNVQQGCPSSTPVPKPETVKRESDTNH